MLGATLLWFVALELMAVAAFPLAYRAFSRLPDRGWALSKPLGLLLAGFGTWVLGLTHTLPNSRWTVLLALAAVAALSGLAARRSDVRSFVRTNVAAMVAADLIFVAAFLAFTLLRAQVPEASHTEQPMDFMFLNAVVTSPHYPPQDPWLAGEAVSYYYFGYLIVGTVTLLTGIAAPVAYNLGLATVAGLAAVAAYGIVSNLVRLAGGSRDAAALTGMAGVLLLLVASNLLGALELARAAGAGTAEFWASLGVDGLTAPTAPGTSWYPEGVWWWWRSSRVIPGTINEFPFFSLLLGDLHPHVMSIPFLLLALGFAVQCALHDGLLLPSSPGQGLRALAADWPLAVTAPVAIGALAAINLWDLPVGLALVSGALLLNAARPPVLAQTGQGAHRWAPARAVIAGALLIGLAVLLFVPFYRTFDGQADGVVPLAGLRSRPAHLAIVWGVPGALAVAVVLAALHGPVAAAGWARRLFAAGALGFAPVLIWLQPIWGPLAYAGGGLLIAVTWAASRRLRLGARRISWAGRVPPGVPGTVTAAALGLAGGLLTADGLRHADDSPGVALVRLAVVVPMAVVVTAALFGAWSWARRAGVSHGVDGVAPVLGILAVAGALVMGAELFHVVDFFGGGLRRFNTVFKLYYQAWVLLAVAAAFALWFVGSRLDRRGALGRAALLAFGAVIVLGASAVAYYPLAAGSARAAESPLPMSLDAQRHVAASAPGEYAAIAWLRANTPRDAIVLEAAAVRCGDGSGFCSDWTDAGRVAGSTGRPTVIGWEQHELQWRDASAISGRREDVRVLYDTQDVAQARLLLVKYGVDYVVVGTRERGAYGDAGVAKFTALGTLVFPTAPGSQSAPPGPERPQGAVLVYDVRPVGPRQARP